MSSDCIEVSDAIWTWAREGVELTEEELRHARACSSCAAALAEAQACVAALRCIEPHPAAPDCRSAVAARIAMRRTRTLRAWAYACGLLLVAAIVGGALLRPHGGRPASEQAKRPPEVRSYAPPVAPLPAPEPKPQMRAHEPEQPWAAQPLPPRRPSYRRSRPAHHAHRTPPANTVAPPPRKPPMEKPEPQVSPPATRSPALAYVTWPIARTQTDSYDYSYTVTDPATGETTRCSVKREGNAIEIKMESKPAKTDMKPAKERGSNEAVRCG
jgi:hypothetical protein